MTALPAIASKLAAALRNMPCACVTTGSWPRFAAVKAHPERTCARCAALNQYDAHIGIVQMTGVRPDDTGGRG